MARVFSWCLKSVDSTIYAYLASTSNESSWSGGHYIKNKKIDDKNKLKDIANVVGNYSLSEYTTYFNQMKDDIETNYFHVEGWRDAEYYFDVAGDTLVMLTGEGSVGPVGIQGPQGEQGIQGEKGDTGMAGNGRNIMCYCGLSSGLTPTARNVSGGKFYPNKWHIEYPTDTVGFPGTSEKCEWGDSNEFGSDKVVWMTNADFPSSTGTSLNEAVDPIMKSGKTWSDPIQISGPKGDNGADGDSIEFVYKRCETREDPVPEKPTGTTEQEAETQGWTDHPMGISLDYKVEYMCQHIKQNEVWGEWSDPVLWASWGEDGNDGDGIEYIFAVTQEYGKDAIRNKLPKMTDSRLADHWQDPEIWDYIRENHLEEYYTPWTDDPSDVSQDEPYEWVSIRRRKWVADESKSVFGPFEEPVLWAHWGKNGEKGDDGTSLDLKVRKDTLGHLLKDIYNGAVETPKNGSTYAIGEGSETKMYVFMQLDDSVIADYHQYNPPTDPSSWELEDDAYLEYYQLIDGKPYWFSYCGLFSGEDGKNAYMHMKYGREWKESYTDYDHYPVTIEGKTVDICFTQPSTGTIKGETPGPYIAVYCDNMHDDNSDLRFYCGLDPGTKNLWEKFRGDDGQSFGQEQIFIRAATLASVPKVKVLTQDGHGYEAGEKVLDITYSQSVFNTTDYVPSGYSDVPMGIVNGVYNFEWVCTRRLVENPEAEGGKWSYFSEPALYNEAGDTLDFQVEYSTWSGDTTPVLENAGNYTDPSDGTFNELAWRQAHASTGPWSDNLTNDTVWMATATRVNKNSNSATTQWSEWQITRCKGITGKAGNGRNIMCYCVTDSAYTVTLANVSGGTFYPNKWEIHFPTDPLNHVTWQDSNENDDKNKRVWMINADFPSSTGTSEGEYVLPIEKEDSQHNKYTWSTPICITGEKGENGADGESVEFIYYLTTNRDDANKPDRPTISPQEPDYKPEVYVHGEDMHVTWTDNPQGISEDKKVEYMCTRSKDADGLWGQWSQVNLWSSWGEDGIDGDGVEYIFAVTQHLNDQTEQANLRNKLPKMDGSGPHDLSSHWQDPEIWDYIKESGWENDYSPWTDDPSDVSISEPYEWVAIRRKKYDSSVGDAVFGPFEEPVLWARWADDGESVFTAFAFTNRRVGDGLSGYTVEGGSYDNPVPTKTKNPQGTVVQGITWTDAPKTWPANVMAVSGAPVVWMVSGVFEQKYTTSAQTKTWSSPREMTDTADFEVMYSPRENAEDIKTVTGFKKVGKDIDSGWLTRAEAKGWYDEVTDFTGDAYWMATITGTNGVFNDNDWQIFKVKGEKGNPGDDGVSKFNSIVFKRTNTKPATPTGGSYSSPVPSGWEDTVPTGSSILWMSSRLFTSNGVGQAAAWSEPSQATDNEYIDYEWNKYYTTEEAGMAHLPTKTSPSDSQSNPDANYWWDEPIQGAILMAVRQVSNGQYVGDWKVSKIKGENGSVEDLQYIKDIFPNVDASADTATLRGFLGVMSGNSDVVAFLNGGSGFTDSEHGTLMIAAGVEGLNNANNAKFRVYEDGTVCAKDAEIDGSITAATGSIGGIEINSEGIGSVGEDGNGFSFGKDGSININNKNVQINNSGITFLSSGGEPVLSVANTSYSSLTQFVTSMSGNTVHQTVGTILPIDETSERKYVYSTEQFFINPTFTTPITIPNSEFTIPAGSKQMVKITFNSIYINGAEHHDGGYNVNIEYHLCSIRTHLPFFIVDNQGHQWFLDSFDCNTQQAISHQFRGSSYSYMQILPEGTYHLQLGDMYNMYSMGFEINAGLTFYDTGHGYPLCSFESWLCFDSMEINGTPVNSGTEIFRNGFAVKNNADNYFFIATPDGTSPTSLVMSVRSNGKGFDLDNGDWHWVNLTPHS